MGNQAALTETEARRVAELVSSRLTLDDDQLVLTPAGRRALAQDLRAYAHRPTFRSVLRQVAFTAAQLETRGGFVQPARELIGLVTELLPALTQSGADRLERSAPRNRFV